MNSLLIFYEKEKKEKKKQYKYNSYLNYEAINESNK